MRHPLHFNFSVKFLAYLRVTVSVCIAGDIASGVTWGLLSGRPSKTRVLAGPCDTCPEHPRDIIILRDFHTNTSSLNQVVSIASRQFDILLMKMCEDFVRKSSWLFHLIVADL